jgi:hypothetical protein
MLFQNYKCIIPNEKGKITRTILENDLYRLQNHNIVKKNTLYKPMELFQI